MTTLSASNSASKTPDNLLPIFRDLPPDEERDFRSWARENDPPNMESWEIYHPACRDEWMERGKGPADPLDAALDACDGDIELVE